MNHRQRSVLSIVIGAFSAAMGVTEAAPAQGGRLPITPNRADVAASYLAFEQAYGATTVTGHAQRQVHRNFDYAASLFFAGRFAEAIERIEELTWFLERQAADGNNADADRAIRSLAVRLSAAHSIREPHGRPLRATIFSMYPAPIDEQLTLALVNDAGERVWQRDTTLVIRRSFSIQELQIDDLPDDLPEGTYRAVLVDRAGNKRVGASVAVFDRSFYQLRSDLQARLEVARHNAAKDDADLQRAIEICMARLRLLTSTPSPLNSIEFLLDPLAHARELEKEIDALMEGRNPYRNRPGEHWRIVRRSSGNSPMMVYAPQAIDAGEPLPLVIALHGAGGDETLFMRAYGAGMIRDLAESRGFIVASPLTYHIMADGSLVDRIIDDLSADYAVDRDRVHLIGHSLGGGTASALLASGPERFAAACCIAGASPFTSPNGDAAYPPVLVIAAELDTIITPQRLRDLSDAGVEGGLPIEFRLEENLGHVLVVNEILDEAIDWLLAR